MFKNLVTRFASEAGSRGIGRKLQIRTESLGELNPAELGRVVAAVDRRHRCACATDVSNSCCGPNGSC